MIASNTIEHFDSTEEYGLWSQEQYNDAFIGCSLDVRFDDLVLSPNKFTSYSGSLRGSVLGRSTERNRTYSLFVAKRSFMEREVETKLQYLYNFLLELYDRLYSH
jgi:hypothetical protein